MNFTREPIIETVITPKDGYKLTIRNSKGGSHEEYSVDAIEVVSFGQSMFFRSQERPKPFLLPVSDYEVMETKETRVVLKNPPVEGSIKIGGGKLLKPAKEQEEKPPAPVMMQKPHDESLEDRPRRRKSSSRRRRGEHEQGESHQPRQHSGEIKPPRIPAHGNGQEGEKRAPHEKTGSEHEAPISTTMFKNLIPPPPGLISEKFQQEKYLYAIKEASVTVEKKEIVLDDQTTPMEVAPATLDEVREEKETKHETSSEEARTPRYHAAPKDQHQETLSHVDPLKH